MIAFFEIGTNYCEKVTLGWPDKPDNFFLQCYHQNDVPVISARVFGANGTLLFELRDNELTARSRAVYRRIGFHNGWRIVDEDNRKVLEITTEQSTTPMGLGKVTHINGDLYDKAGRQVGRASPKGLIVQGCPMAMG